MAEIRRVPLIRCDNCGATAEKTHVRDNEYKKPMAWGYVKCGATHFERYPNYIDVIDLCPSCTKIVNVAIEAALRDAAKSIGE